MMKYFYGMMILIIALLIECFLKNLKESSIPFLTHPMTFLVNGYWEATMKNVIGEFLKEWKELMFGSIEFHSQLRGTYKIKIWLLYDAFYVFYYWWPFNSKTFCGIYSRNSSKILISLFYTIHKSF